MGSERPKTVLRAAQELETRGDVKEASRKYASLIPVFRRRGKYSEALMACEKALSLSPDSSKLYLTKAICLWDLKKNEEARRELEKLAVVALRQNKIGQCLEWIQEKLSTHSTLQRFFLEKMLEVERTRADIFLLLSQVLTNEGQIERALEIAFAALKTGQAENLCHDQLRQLLLKRGRAEDLEYLENLVNKNWSVDKAKQFILGVSSAEERREGGALDLPRETEDSGISGMKSLSESTEFTLKKMIQELEERLGDRPEGVETITGLVGEFKERALEVVSSDFKAVLDLSIAFKEMGLFAEAKEFISKIPIESELYLQAQSLLGEIEFELGSLFAAMDIFQQLLRLPSLENKDEIKPDDRDRVSLVEKQALYYCTRIYFELGDFKKAQQFAEKLSELDYSYRNLGVLRNVIAQKMSGGSKR